MRARKKIIKNFEELMSQKPKEEIIIAFPSVFSTVINLVGVLKILNNCKSEAGNDKLLSLDFTLIEQLNAAALALLLSVVSDLHTLGIRVQCKMPLNQDARMEIVESGFLEHFTNNLGERTFGKNKIFVKGKGKTDQVRIAEEIKKAMNTVFGKDVFNQPMQGAVVEMMANSVNHAYIKKTGKNNYYLSGISKQKRWYLSVVHNHAEKQVYFTFVDNGLGLLRTIRRKFLSRIGEIMDDKSVIERAFEGKYGSSTQLVERGRGLPTIQSALKKGAFRNLKIITDGCAYSFDNQELINLTEFFEGTTYFWTLDTNCTYGNT